LTVLSDIFVPTSNNLSLAWAEVFLKLLERGVKELSDVRVSVTEFDDRGNAQELDAVRKRLDQELIAQGEQMCHTVANTIFPENL
jgi:hypothetical protein